MLTLLICVDLLLTQLLIFSVPVPTSAYPQPQHSQYRRHLNGEDNDEFYDSVSAIGNPHADISSIPDDDSVSLFQDEAPESALTLKPNPQPNRKPNRRPLLDFPDPRLLNIGVKPVSKHADDDGDDDDVAVFRDEDEKDENSAKILQNPKGEAEDEDKSATDEHESRVSNKKSPSKSGPESDSEIQSTVEPELLEPESENSSISKFLTTLMRENSPDEIALINYTYHAEDWKMSKLPSTFRSLVHILHRLSTFSGIQWKGFNEVCEDRSSSSSSSENSRRSRSIISIRMSGGHDEESSHRQVLTWDQFLREYNAVIRNQILMFTRVLRQAEELLQAGGGNNNGTQLKNPEATDLDLNDLDDDNEHHVLFLGRVSILDSGSVDEREYQRRVIEDKEYNDLPELVKKAIDIIFHDTEFVVRTKRNYYKILHLRDSISTLCSPLEYLVCISPQGFVKPLKQSEDEDDHDHDDEDDSGNVGGGGNSGGGNNRNPNAGKATAVEGQLARCGCRDNFVASQEKCYVKPLQECNRNNLFLEPDMEILPVEILQKIPHPKCQNQAECINDIVCNGSFKISSNSHYFMLLLFLHCVKYYQFSGSVPGIINHQRII